MATYSDLLTDHFYLVQENEGEEIVLVQPLMETDNCVLLMLHDDEESTFWRKKSDDIYELVDELSEEQVENYENLFEEDEEDITEAGWDELK